MTDPVLATLRQLHDAIVEDLRAHYLDRVETVAAYDPFPQPLGQEPQPLATPAILLQLESIDPGSDDGTDRQALRLTFAAHCVLSLRTAQVQLELREMAADVLNRVRHRRWGFPGGVQEPQALSAQPGEFVPGAAGFDSWQVRWEQEVYLGPDAWAGGLAPAQVWLGIAPRIGELGGTAADYFRIDPEDLPA